MKQDQYQCGFLYFYAPAAGQASEGGTFPPDVESDLIARVAPGGVSSRRALCRAPGLGDIHFDEGWVNGMDRPVCSDLWGVLGRRSDQEGLELQLDKSRQRWRVWKRYKAGDTERGTLWVGHWLDRRPGPSDLVRGRLWPTSESARLGDGQDWLLPVLRYFTGEWKGPYEWNLTDEGQWENRMESKYAPLAARGERLFQTLMSVPDDVWDNLSEDARAWRPKQSEVSEPFLRIEGAQLVSDALNLNYCLSEPEIALLGLLTDETLETAYMNLLGDKTLESFIRDLESKKKAEAAGGVGSGNSGDAV